MLKEFEERGIVDPGAAAIDLEQIQEPARTLKFPGKVLAADDALYIADTNHHRIVKAGLDGSIQTSYGRGDPGLLDGPAGRAAVQQPQGMAKPGTALYAADTENPAIRSIDLESGVVTTLAGTGEQAQRAAPAGPGRSTALSSPWDLALAGRLLYIAMAGAHQIWSMDLDTGAVAPFAGTGREGLLDGPSAEAWFAQPSGLALGGGHLYVADSEVSAVRDIALRPRAVTTIAGEGLFVFGDRDGEGGAVRLQPPLGVTGRAGRRSRA